MKDENAFYSLLEKANNSELKEYLEMLNKEIRLSDLAIKEGMEEDDEEDIRKCSECNTPMKEGYCISGGCEYYCSDECLHKHISPDEWIELYDDGNSDSYYTEWED